MLSPTTKNIIANFFKILVVFINQILLIPAYLVYMGIELYSDWLILSAITSFFTMSDIGLNNVTNNLFSIKLAENKNSECQILLVNNLLFIILILSIVIILFLSVAGLVNLTSLLGLHAITNNQAIVISLLFLLQIMIQMCSGVFDSIYNANHIAFTATYINNIARLFYAICIFIGLVLHLEIQYVVLLGLLPYCIAFIYKYIDSKQIYPFSFKLNFFDFKYLLSLIKPSVGFMFFPLGNAILFQGITLLVNTFFGAVVLVQFNTMRTMMNFIRNISQAISAGIKPEFTIQYGKKNHEGMNTLLKKSIIFCTVAVILAILCLNLGGELIYTMWTKGKVMFSESLMVVFSIVLFVNMIWESTCITLTATNNHFKFSLIYVIACCITVATAYVCGCMGYGIITVSSCLFLTDMIMAYYSIKYSRYIINSE